MVERPWTPGPWEAAPGTVTGQVVIAPGEPKVRRNVAACGGPNREANARLIAAAPDMAERGSVLLAMLKREMPTVCAAFSEFRDFEATLRAAGALSAEGEA